MMTRIEVTRDNIATGNPGENESCAVALAVKAKCLPDTEVQVDGYSVDLDLPFSFVSRINLETNETVKKFVADFDDGKPVEPFAFDLDIPDEFLLPIERIGGQR
jgi:hypothetical protein